MGQEEGFHQGKQLKLAQMKTITLRNSENNTFANISQVGIAWE